MTFREFETQYPQQTMILQNGKTFVYRYAKHPEAKQTVVLLTGGIGLSDLFYLHFQRFSREFSVMTFDYQTQFVNDREFAAAVAELLTRSHIKGWLVGQSMGGIVAQIIAKDYPQVVEGLVLSNTCSLSRDMGEKAMSHLMGMLEDIQRSKKLLSFVPFGLYKKRMKKEILEKKTGDLTKEEKARMEELCDIMVALLDKPYASHMIDLLIDIKNHLGHAPEDFAYLKGRVLLILSEDDETFTEACKTALIQIMPEPEVVTELTGGHLALLVKLEKYAELVTEFIRNCSDR